jgi:hypothetical protein
MVEVKKIKGENAKAEMLTKVKKKNAYGLTLMVYRKRKHLGRFRLYSC